MYREQAPPWVLRDWVQCSWRHRMHGTARIVPDAHVDLVWNGQTLWLAGPDTRPVHERVQGEVFGVRLRTGRAAAVLGLPASSLRDGRVELRALWDVGEALDRLQQEDPIAVLLGLVRARRAADRLVDALVERLRRDPSRRVAALAEELGVSERQLNRRCTEAVGYGPKFLARVLRCRRSRAADFPRRAWPRSR